MEEGNHQQFYLAVSWPGMMHWCSSGMNINGVANCSPIGFKTPSKRGRAWLVQ